MTISLGEAIALVEAAINSPGPGRRQDLVVYSTEERPWGWVVWWSSRRYAETRAVEDLLVGASPFLVNKLDGSLHPTWSGASLESQIQKYEETLDATESDAPAKTEPAEPPPAFKPRSKLLELPERFGEWQVGRGLHGGDGQWFHWAKSDTGADAILQVSVAAPARLETVRRQRALLAKLDQPGWATPCVDVIEEHIDERYLFALVLQPILGCRISSAFAKPVWIDDLLRLSLPQAMDVFSQTCRGLEALSRVGCELRRFSPINIYLDFDGKVRLGPWAERTTERRTRGTVTYDLPFTAPEVLLDQRRDECSDVHALGSILIRVLTGKYLYLSDENEPLVVAPRARIDVSGPDLEPSALALPVPALAELLSEMVAPRPEFRVPDFATVMRRLAGLPVEGMSTWHGELEKRPSLWSPVSSFSFEL